MKRFIFLVAVCLLFYINSALYAFYAHNLSLTNIFREVWALSQYVTLILAIIGIEEIARLLWKNNQKKKSIFAILMFPVNIIEFVLVYLIAYFPVGQQQHLIFSIVFVIVAFLQITLYYILLNSVKVFINKQQISVYNSKANIDLMSYSDVYEYLISRTDSKKAKARLIISNALISLFYLLFAISIIIINVFSFKYNAGVFLIVCSLLLACTLILWVRGSLGGFSTTKKIIESINILLSTLLYVFLQWKIYPMTFNILLTSALIISIVIIINNNLKLSNALFYIYRNAEKEN